MRIEDSIEPMERLEFRVFSLHAGSCSSSRIPTGFRPLAQGCEARATLGKRAEFFFYPNGVASHRIDHLLQPRWGRKALAGRTQGSLADSATAGLEDGIPLGFSEAQHGITWIPGASGWLMFPDLSGWRAEFLEPSPSFVADVCQFPAREPVRQDSAEASGGAGRWFGVWR